MAELPQTQKPQLLPFPILKKKKPFTAKAAPVHNLPAETTAASQVRPVPFNKAFANSKSIRSGSWLFPARSKDAELEKIYSFLNLSLESFSAKLHFVRSSLFSGGFALKYFEGFADAVSEHEVGVLSRMNHGNSCSFHTHSSASFPGPSPRSCFQNHL